MGSGEWETVRDSVAWFLDPGRFGGAVPRQALVIRVLPMFLVLSSLSGGFMPGKNVRKESGDYLEPGFTSRNARQVLPRRS